MNLKFIGDNFMDIFEVKVKNNTFREHDTYMPVLDVTDFEASENNTQLKFAFTFSEPYMLGLLNKIPDKVIIRLRGAEILMTDGTISKTYYGGHFRGMILPDNDPDYWRIYHDKCIRDRNLDAEDERRLL